jgi:hypothetical protein
MNRKLAVSAALLALQAPASADPVSVLFVGNSYTFARVDPVLRYNAANVRDLTRPQGPLNGGRDPALAFTTGAPFTNLSGTNSYPAGTINAATGLPFESYSPHSQTNGWGGVAGIFKQLTVQAGLDYDVALSTRNAATLRGHMLNTANSNWDLRSNISSQTWGQVVLQEQSDEPLPSITVGGVALGSNFENFNFYADLIEDYVHNGAASSYRERDVIPGSTNGTLRTIPANPNARAATEVFLFQTWARPNLVNAPGATTINPATGNASYNTAVPATSFYADLGSMTRDLASAYSRAATNASSDGTGGFKAIARVGEAFQLAVDSGVATRDMYAAGALSDGLIDLWFNDGTHASAWGSYLSALTLFGTLTQRDPSRFGGSEIAARDLGISASEAVALQQVAARQLGYPVPAPGTIALLSCALLPLGAIRLRRRAPLA